MRTLVVLLCCLASSVYGASLGYSYDPNSSGSSNDNGGSYDGGFGHHSIGGGGGGLNIVSSSNQGGSHNGGQSNGATRGSDNLSEPISGPVEFNKEFYTYTAPEAEFKDNNNNNQEIVNSLKRNLRVIFIKGPESSGLEDAVLQLAKASSDDSTAIYVLNKQADLSSLAQKFNALSNQNTHKPEVHFVKYRTPADAENAKNAIQAQYDSLGGGSSNHDGGVAAVLDFASKSGGEHRGQAGHAGPDDRSHFGSSSSQTYLPPNKRI